MGKNGKNFNVYKYRTMIQESSGIGWTEVNDSRISTAGKILRFTYLDELPQSVNLILGNMSVVGPRPEQIEIVEKLRELIPFYDERHLVKPGLTGWAQVRCPYGASAKAALEKLQYDLYYIKNQSLILDTIILFETARIVLFGKLAR